MKTEVSILHQAYPSRLRRRVQEKLQGLESVEQRLTSITARLERQRTDHRVELVANVGGAGTLVAHVSGDSFGAVLDEAVARMKSQLRKTHDRLVQRRHGRRG